MLIAVAVATAGVAPAFLLGGLVVQVRGELEFGQGAFGLAVAIFFAASSLASVVFGRVVQRIGSHTGMRLAAICGAAALFGICFFAVSWITLVVFLVLGGFANAVGQPATNLSLAREVPDNHQGLSFGVKQSAIPTATLLAGLAVPLVALTIGWRFVFLGAAVLALLVAYLVPPGRDVVAPSKDRGPSDARTASLVLLAVGIGLGSTAATPLGAFVVESSVASGMREGTAGLLLALGSAANILVRVVFGSLADGMSGGRLRIAAAMLALGTAGFVMLGTGSGALLVVGTLIAFAAGWGWPGLFNFAIVKSSPAAPAAATGITQTGASAGAAIGPLIFGLVAEASGYEMAWLLCGVLAFLAALAILLGRSRVLRDRAASPRKGGAP
jgi:MFS family permease